MPKTENLVVQNSADILLTKVINLVPTSKKDKLQELFNAFKQEFPTKSIGERTWSEEQKAAAREIWAAKRNSQKFWVRNQSGEVNEFMGIENVAKLFCIRPQTLHCYLSVGNGSTSIRGSRISKFPLQKMSVGEAWAADYYAKHGFYPNPAENPYDRTGRY